MLIYLPPATQNIPVHLILFLELFPELDSI